LSLKELIGLDNLYRPTEESCQYLRKIHLLFPPYLSLFNG
jgi:hypothetical protein